MSRKPTRNPRALDAARLAEAAERYRVAQELAALDALAAYRACLMAQNHHAAARHATRLIREFIFLSRGVMPRGKN